MKVKAIQLGYYDMKRRKEGDVFELLDEKDFSKKWMISLEDAKKKVVKKEVKKEEKLDLDVI